MRTTSELGCGGCRGLPGLAVLGISLAAVLMLSACGGDRHQTPSKSNDLDLAGCWEPEDPAATSSSGIVSAIALSADGDISSLPIVAVDMEYRLNGSRLEYRSLQRSSSSAERPWEALGTITSKTNNTMVQHRADGKILDMTRHGRSGDSGIVGVWTYTHHTGQMAYERYTDTGLLQLRIPLPGSAGRGHYLQTGDSISIEMDEDSSVLRGSLSVDGALCISKPDGTLTRYLRIGSSAWYQLPE